MKPLTLVLAVFIVLFSPLSVFAQHAAFDAALEQAKDEGKGVAVYFHADAFNVPESFEEFVPDDWTVNTFLERKYIVISVDVDTEEGKNLADRFPSLGMYPVLALMDSSGENRAFQIFDTQETDAQSLAHFFLNHELMVGDLKGD